jgi:hypothetical protein
MEKTIGKLHKVLSARHAPVKSVTYSGGRSALQGAWLPLKKEGAHPSEEGLRRSDCHRDEDGIYWFAADRDPARVADLLERRRIDLSRSGRETLGKFVPGFEDPATEELLREAREVEQKKSQAQKELEAAQLALSEALALQSVNTDLEQVGPIRQQVRNAEERIEDVKVYLDTCERKILSIEERLHSTLRGFREEQAAKIEGQLRPVADRFSSDNKANWRRWQKEGVPLLQRYAEISPKPIPNTPYFQTPKLGDVDLRSLKALKAYPAIKRTESGRYDFVLKHLEDES